jgi:hypothetical protein
MGAFRARIRHLRNIGLPPRLPQPGSGKQIPYTRNQALAILLALRLEEVGHTPETAARWAVKILHSSAVQRLPGGQYEKGQDIYAGIIPGSEEPLTAMTKQAIAEMSEYSAVISLLNVTRCMRELDSALNRTQAIER